MGEILSNLVYFLLFWEEFLLTTKIPKLEEIHMSYWLVNLVLVKVYFSKKYQN